ncbi:hypothetical protein ACEWA7_20315 [Vibrio parahaemolyticus]
MKSKRSLVDAAIELANKPESLPDACPSCKGKGKTKSLFSKAWDCFHCDGLGYVGDPMSIAKWFKEALIKRTEKIKLLKLRCSVLAQENEALKSIYPDWEARLKEHYEVKTNEKYRSRFD